MPDKSVQDAFADAANTVVEHAVDLVKKGAHTSVVNDAIMAAERLSRHVGEIEDHARMSEQNWPNSATSIASAPAPGVRFKESLGPN